MGRVSFNPFFSFFLVLEVVDGKCKLVLMLKLSIRNLFLFYKRECINLIYFD